MWHNFAVEKSRALRYTQAQRECAITVPAVKRYVIPSNEIPVTWLSRGVRNVRVFFFIPFVYSPNREVYVFGVSLLPKPYPMSLYFYFFSNPLSLSLSLSLSVSLWSRLSCHIHCRSVSFPSYFLFSLSQSCSSPLHFFSLPRPTLSCAPYNITIANSPLRLACTHGAVKFGTS